MNNEKCLMNLLMKDLLNLWISKKRINPDNLVYQYKTEGIPPKAFGNYQDPIKLFIGLRDGNINLKEALKD